MTTGSATITPTSTSARVASILRQFAEKPWESRRLTDVSIGTGLPPATTHRYLKSMVNAGLLGRDDDDRYELGELVRAIASNLGAVNESA